MLVAPELGSSGGFLWLPTRREMFPESIQPNRVSVAGLRRFDGTSKEELTRWIR